MPGVSTVNYPGGKGASFRRIINCMPPHDVYIETHLGGGNVLERKRPALLRSYGIELDPLVVAQWRARTDLELLGVELHEGDGVSWLSRFVESWHGDPGRVVVYCDPPYLRETRSSFPLYQFEFSDDEHRRLLGVLRRCPFRVLLSGYRSELYDWHLSDWPRVDFQVGSRGGARTESLWRNFELTGELHDYTWLGDDFRERERINRKRTRWRARFAKLPAAERRAMFGTLVEVMREERDDGFGGD